MKATIEVEVREHDQRRGDVTLLVNGRVLSVMSSRDAIRDYGLPVPERTTAVTVHLTDTEREAVRDGFPPTSCDSVLGKLAAAVEDTNERTQP